MSVDNMTEPPAAGPGEPETLPPKVAATAVSPPWLGEIWTRIKEHKVIQWRVGYFAAAPGFAHAQELIGRAYEWSEIVGQILTNTGSGLRHNSAGRR